MAWTLQDHWGRENWSDSRESLWQLSEGSNKSSSATSDQMSVENIINIKQASLITKISHDSKTLPHKFGDL